MPIPTLHEALYGKPDPLAPHLEEALKSLGVVSSAIWRQTLEAMAGEIRHAGQRGRMQRAKGIGTYQRGNKRVDAKKMLDDIARFAKSINDLMDLEEVRGALDFFAPISQRGIDDVAGFEYLQQLETRASRARAKIRTGKGGGLLRDDLGIPSPRLLCAACVLEAMWAIDGQRPGSANPRALATCRALWLAAGGSDKSQDDPGGLWRRHLDEAKGAGPAARSARWTARSHVAASVQN